MADQHQFSSQRPPKGSPKGQQTSQEPGAERWPFTPDHYLNQITPSVRASLNAEQWAEVRRVVDLALPKPSPKIIDLRFEIDLLISRYYIVLMMGKDRRRSSRSQKVSGVTRWANWIAAIVLLLGVNLAISAAVLLLAYLLKSALGINLLPGHFRGFGQ